MKKSLGAKTIGFPTPVLVIGSYDRHGTPNLMTAAWAGICCSSPPCAAVSLRKVTHSFQNLVDRKAFTINVPGAKQIKVADFLGTVSGAQQNKFIAAGLTAVHSAVVDAPYVEEFALVLECKLVHTFELGLHTQFVGEIIDVKADETVLDDNDLPLVERIAPLIYSPGNRCYYAVGELLGKAYSIGKK
jgi:flavin reductase (DIM6/NTAB) family NADH-FMN oxidoreductase RutF